MTLLAFLGVALLVVLAGHRVAFYGDVLAEKTRMGRSLVGLFLVAATTSLPELHQAPDRKSTRLNSSH